MQLLTLQNHFFSHGIEHAYRLDDWKHDVYQNPRNRRKFTIPIDEDEIPDAFVQIGCIWLGIDGVNGEQYQDILRDMLEQHKKDIH